tara:strand:+ start:4994 stop:5647 length:654 start_codon:yes stop_codon:yes gene_type:complete
MDTSLLDTGLYGLRVFRPHLGVLAQLSRAFSVTLQGFMDCTAQAEQVPCMIAFCRRRARWLDNDRLKVGRHLVNPTTFSFSDFETHLGASSAVTTLSLACSDAYQKIIYQRLLCEHDGTRLQHAAGVREASRMQSLLVLQHYVNDNGDALLTLKRLLSRDHCLRSLAHIDIVSCSVYVDTMLIDCLLCHTNRRGITLCFVVSGEREKRTTPNTSEGV